MHKILKFNNHSQQKDINQYEQQQCHLIFRLPEIVEQIVQHLIPLNKIIPISSNSSSSSSTNNQLDKVYTDIHPCLFVNWLWHDCASRYIWRYVRFNEKKTEYQQFLKFASIISQEPIEVFKSKPLSSTTASTLAVAKPPTPPYQLNPSTSSSTSSSTVINNSQQIEKSSDSGLTHPILSNFVTSIKPIYQHDHDLNINNGNNSTNLYLYQSSQKDNNNSQYREVNREEIDPNDPAYYNLLNDRRYSNTTTLSTSSSTSTSCSTSSSSRTFNLGSKIRSITLRKLKDENITEPLRYIGYHASHIQALDIYICDYVTNHSLYSFFEHGTLTFVCLAGCQYITDEGIIHLAKSCRQLEHLDLRACGKVTDTSICQVAYHSTQLKHLNVGRVKEGHRITDRSIRLIALHTKVSVMGLAGCDITDHSLLLLANERKLDVERISINNCVKVTNLSLQAFVRYCPKLTVFEMKECHLINDWEAVATLTENKVLLTLCEEQSRLCAEWAKKHRRTLEIKAPIK